MFIALLSGSQVGSERMLSLLDSTAFTWFLDKFTWFLGYDCWRSQVWKTVEVMNV